MANQIDCDVFVRRNALKNPISYVQGTDLLPIIMHFLDFDIPSGATANVFVLKPDKTAYYSSATISGNDVTIDVDKQMFVVTGFNVLQVEIASGGETLVNFAQPVKVEPNFKTGDYPESETKIEWIDDAIKQAQEAANEAQQAAKDSETAIENANTAITGANQAAQNANETAQELKDKAAAGDFDGPQGPSGTMTIGGVQTLQPDEEATVTNTGTPENAVLNFGIPRGEDGMTDLTAEYKDDSSYTCQPTVNAPVVVKEVDGKTEQVETTGAQLFDASKIATKTQGGATVTNNGDGSFTIFGSGTVSQGMETSYTLQHEEFVKLFKQGTLTAVADVITNPKFYINLYNSSGFVKTLIELNGKKQVQGEILQEYLDSDYYLVIGFTIPNASAIISGTIKPMLYQDGDGTWEPYTGGSPAPSPDYPQVIKGVGGMGYFDGEWVKGNISSTGAIGTGTTGITSANAIPCKQNDNIAVTYEDSIDVIAVAFYNASGAYISTSTSGNSVDTFTATAPANAASFKVNLRVVSGSTITPSDAKYCTVTVNGEYQTGVQTTGAQLFDASKIATKTQGGATVTNNGDGSFTIGGSGALSDVYSNCHDLSHDDTVKLLKEGWINLIVEKTTPYFYASIVVGNETKLSLNSDAAGGMILSEYLEDDSCCLRIGFFSNANLPISGGTIKPMLYQDGDGTYQPYHHTAISIPLTSPLYEGDKLCYVKPGESYVDADGTTVIADRILYGVCRENAVVVFDGSEDENWKANGCGNRYNFTLNNSNNKYTENTAECNFFKYNTNVYLDDNDEIGFIITGSTLYCRFGSKSEINSVSALKTWLQSNPLTVVYKLAQPYFEPFSDQSIFYALRTDDTLSYVYSNDPIEPVLTVEVAKNSTGGYLLESYAQAQKNAISEASSQSRLSAIEQQLVNQATAPTE